jgi:hypothetical protein
MVSSMISSRGSIEDNAKLEKSVMFLMENAKEQKKRFTK